MKKKNRAAVILLGVSAFIFAAVAIQYVFSRHKTEVLPVTEESPTLIPSVSLRPTKAPTEAPTEIPTKIPTEMPTETPAEAPTEAPDTLSPIKEEVSACLGRIRMGDAAWGEVYENRVFVITGTGSTYDYDDLMEYYLDFNKKNGFDLLESGAVTILVEEGITRIGRYSLCAHCDAERIELPGTLEEIAENAFYGTGTENAEWIGLDMERINIKDNAFTDAGGKGLEVLSNNAVASPTAAPTNTPTPVPTAFPTAAPENPRELLSLKAGEHAEISVWDNGYVYVKGSGAVTVNAVQMGEQMKNSIGCETLSGKVVLTHIIVEEGITVLEESSLYMFSSRELQYIQLPSTLTACRNAFGSAKNTITCTMYQHGRKKEFTIYRYDSFERYTTIDDQIVKELE